jgi:hypothetical protein
MVESTGLILVQDVLHNVGLYTAASNKLITTEKNLKKSENCNSYGQFYNQETLKK